LRRHVDSCSIFSPQPSRQGATWRREQRRTLFRPRLEKNIQPPFITTCIRSGPGAATRAKNKMAASAEKLSSAGEAAASHSVPRKYKASDLPLHSATRAAIESLVHSFKKGGAYDSIRRQVWDKFKASVRKAPFEASQFFLIFGGKLTHDAGLRSTGRKVNTRSGRARGRAQPTAIAYA
jgi:hypothetical protein